MRLKSIGIFLCMSALVGCATKQEAKLTTTTSAQQTEQTTTQIKTLSEKMQFYPAKGKYAIQSLGWELPLLKSKVILYSVDEKGENNGLYKFSKLAGDWIPYGYIELNHTEGEKYINKILDDKYLNKTDIISLSNEFYVPILLEWKHTESNTNKTIISDDGVLNISVESKKENALSLYDMRKKLGQIYADRFGELLENYDRQGFYLFDNISMVIKQGIILS